MSHFDNVHVVLVHFRPHSIAHSHNYDFQDHPSSFHRGGARYRRQDRANEEAWHYFDHLAWEHGETILFASSNMSHKHDAELGESYAVGAISS